MEFSFTPQTTSRKYGPEIPIPQQSDRSETIFPLFVCLFVFFLLCCVCVESVTSLYGKPIMGICLRIFGNMFLFLSLPN